MGAGRGNDLLPENKVFIVNHVEIKGKRKRSIYLIKKKKVKYQ